MDELQAGQRVLFRAWWLVLLRGVAGILFGIITFVAPLSSLAALVIVFGAYAFADGVLMIASAIRRRGEQQPTWMLVVHGLAGLAIGIITLFRPAATALGLLWTIAAWALLTGVLEIVAAVTLRKAIKGEWLLALGGLASIVLGVLLVIFPAAGLLTLVFWVAAYALIFGVLMTVLALRLRAWSRPRGRTADFKPVPSHSG
jgi:uncharacterized membrane protein HdeD (DUF308 family)